MRKMEQQKNGFMEDGGNGRKDKGKKRWKGMQ